MVFLSCEGSNPTMKKIFCNVHLFRVPTYLLKHVDHARILGKASQNSTQVRLLYESYFCYQRI